MERILNQEDRIRRAEEIYYRRNNINSNSGKTTTLNVMSKKEYKLFRKIAIQLLICIVLYFAIYYVGVNTDNFSTDFLGNVKSTLCYDADINAYINVVKNGISNWVTKIENNEKEETVILQEETLSAEDVYQSREEEIVQEIEQVTNKETIQDTSSLSQMEQDAEYIKENFSLIKPVIGTITSRFGLRNPTTATVPKYHTGIDIAVNDGTVFVSAMEGIVEKVSSQGDYRKSCKNYKWRRGNFICTL